MACCRKYDGGSRGAPSQAGTERGLLRNRARGGLVGGEQTGNPRGNPTIRQGLESLLLEVYTEHTKS